MSVTVMTMIFKRYPRGGNEKLLALAIGDEARDDGTKIFPSVATLATKSSQSERGVQRLIREMLESGWLLLVHASTGRRGDCNEYRISPEWLAGGDPVAPEVVPDRRTAVKPTGDNLAPVNTAGDGGTGAKLSPVEASKPVDKLSTTGDTQGLSGDTAVSPNPYLPMNTNPPTPRGTGGAVENGGQPKTEPTARDRLRWRWADKRSEIEARGQDLGLGKWDEHAIGRGGEQFVQYAARVFVAHLAGRNVTVTNATMLRALASNTNWAEIVRSMASSGQNDNDTPRSDG